MAVLTIPKDFGQGGAELTAPGLGVDSRYPTTKEILFNIVDEFGVIRTSYASLLTKLDTLTTKLNADAGVTDTNYATDFASSLTLAAITLVKGT